VRIHLKVKEIQKMSSDCLQRQDSLRTVLRKQKRSLSATDRKQSSPDLAGGKGDRNSPFSIRNTPVRSQRGTPTKSERGTPVRSTFTPPRKSVEPAHLTQDCSSPQLKADFYSIDELSPLSTPACSPPASPTTSRSPSPVTAHPRPQSPAVSHSPIRPDSPLLCPHTLSPALMRARSFNKDLRRAASFRAARDRQSLSRNNSPATSRNTSPEPPKSQEVSFRVKKAQGMRKGWKIMVDDGEMMDGSALKTVVSMIKDMEYQGFAVPDRITVKVA